jgi:hypothetical protein
MNLAPMSFGSCVWPCNPTTIKVEYQRGTAQFFYPGGTAAVQETGTAPRKVTGSGRFTGGGCLAEFGRLSKAFSSGGRAKLSIPGMEPFSAMFVSLAMKGVPRPDCVEYEFVFLEDVSSSDTVSGVREEYACKGGESLWEIAARYGTSVDALIPANPQIEWLNALEEGERVAIV